MDEGGRVALDLDSHSGGCAEAGWLAGWPSGIGDGDLKGGEPGRRRGVPDKASVNERLGYSPLVAA